MSDENYVRTCIILANHRDGDRDDVLLNTYTSIRSNRVTRLITISEAAHSERLKLATSLRTKLRAELADAIENRNLSRTKRAALDTQLEGIEVFTDLYMRDDGRVEHAHRYIPHDDEAAVALLRALIGSFRDELRQCRLDGCARFYLAKRNVAGGPRPLYCSKEHTLIADSLKSGRRQQRLRDRRKAARKPK
jgi:hypothetical protein